MGGCVVNIRQELAKLRAAIDDVRGDPPSAEEAEWARRFIASSDPVPDDLPPGAAEWERGLNEKMKRALAAGDGRAVRAVFAEFVEVRNALEDDLGLPRT
jgi:hypothetical protein